MWAFIASKNNVEGEGINFISVMKKHLKDDEIKRAEELAIFCLKNDLKPREFILKIICLLSFVHAPEIILTCPFSRLINWIPATDTD